MTRAEREMMIGRYMSGGMSTAEEQEFFIQVAVDPELRLELKAHRTVESAFRKDRDAEPAGHTALRGRIARTLAANPAQPDPFGAAGSAQLPAAAAATASQAAAGFTFGKWFGAAFLLAATTTVGLMIFSPFEAETSTAPAVVTPVQQAPLPSTTLPAPAVQQKSEVSSESVPDAATSDAATPDVVEPAPAPTSFRRPGTIRSERTSERSARGRVIPESNRGGSPRDEQQASRTTTSLPDLDGSATKRTDSDSIRIGVDLEVNKEK